MRLLVLTHALDVDGVSEILEVRLDKVSNPSLSRLIA